MDASIVTVNGKEFSELTKDDCQRAIRVLQSRIDFLDQREGAAAVAKMGENQIPIPPDGLGGNPA